jgi:DNA replication protein DnaC
MRNQLLDLTKQLRLAGMALALDRELDLAQEQGIPASQTLFNLLSEELRHRAERSILYRIKLAKMPWSWSLATFPFQRQSSISKAQIMELAGLEFLNSFKNILLIGPTGVGKTGLAMGLLREALIAGKNGRFYRAQDLLDELYATLADKSSPKLFKYLAKLDLLVIDEVGYLTMNREQSNAFFKLMDERYGKKSTIITTNLELDEWYDLFKAKHMADALLDRLRHHCITIRIDGPSLREPDQNA